MILTFTNTFKAPYAFNVNEALNLPGEIDIEANIQLRISRTAEFEYREWGIKSIINTASIAHASCELIVNTYGLEQDDITMLYRAGFSQTGDCLSRDYDLLVFDIVCDYENTDTPDDAEIDMLKRKITLS